MIESVVSSVIISYVTSHLNGLPPRPRPSSAYTGAVDTTS
jgi:hypothetical protein